VILIRADGYVEILGRSGLSVKRDGLLVVFADVEAAVERVEGVQRAVVCAAGESRRGARLVAVCLAAGNGLRPDAVRQKCFELLPRYTVPDPGGPRRRPAPPAERQGRPPGRPRSGVKR
jgi:acyl-CoA synthetase (AMP-forming)/AMP-acid ligase II